MTRPIFRLERVASVNPPVGTNSRKPLVVVNRLVGWIKNEVFTRYELVEQLQAAPVSDRASAALAKLQPPIGAPRSASTHQGSPASAPSSRQTQACDNPQARVPQLRVVVVQDGQGPRKHSSRMVISGRMADVCAELDRLAA